MTEAAIRIRGLRKRYGQVEALKGIDLDIPPGSIFGLLGPNGAGKTTLIRLLIGSSRRDAGSVELLGLDPAREKWAVRRALGYMPQSPALYDDLSARENLTFFGNAHGRRDLAERVEEALEFVGLGGRATDPLYKLSGGMLQRVSLAVALLHRPPLLLLDEPTTGIDPRLRASFWGHFRELARAGSTLLISTHQMDEVLYCDRVAILQQGELLSVDTPRGLLQQGVATIRVTRGGEQQQIEAHDYPLRLPQLLREYGLDPAVERIEVEQATLEQVVLAIIAEHERGARREG